MFSIICKHCNSEFELTKTQHTNKKKRYGYAEICKSCAYKRAAAKRPQNNKDYWSNPEIKIKHGNTLKSSEKYQQGIAKRKCSGIKNSMYGKKHKPESLEKMKITRTGKIKPNAKCYQPGYINVIRLVKGYQHKNLNWYKRVKEKYNWKCAKCSSNHILDSHHIKPMAKIVKDLLETSIIENPMDQYLWLIAQPEINDIDLKNGIALCRKCHKAEHSNWGSHHPA